MIQYTPLLSQHYCVVKNFAALEHKKRCNNFMFYILVLERRAFTTFSTNVMHTSYVSVSSFSG